MSLQQTLQAAFQSHQRGQLDQAHALYSQVLAAEPRNHNALHLLGALHSQRGQHDDAVRLIAQAVEIEPRDFGAHSNLGLALAAAGRFDQAIQSYDRALALQPGFFQAHYNRGVALAAMGRYEPAAASFDKAMALQPQAATPFYNKGLALASLDRFAEALALYDKALERDPNLTPAWENRGNMLQALSRKDEALASYDRALALGPPSSRLHYNRGCVLTALQRPEDAIAAFDACLRTAPDFTDAWTNRGNALISLRRHAEALESFHSALAIAPADRTALAGQLEALRLSGRISELLTLSDQLLIQHPDWPALRLERALALHAATRFSEAVNEFDGLLAIAPSAQAWNGRGAALHATNRQEEALASFDKALALKPDHAEALANRAQLIWLLRGNYAAAVADLSKSIALMPEQPYGLGDLLHLKMQVADWTGYEREKSRIDDAVRGGKPAIRPFAYQGLCESPALLQACSRIYAAANFPPAPRPASAAEHSRIRLGYVSGEFKEQATAYLMAGLYEHHDRQKFEVIAIDNTGPDSSPMRKRLEAGFDRFVDISALTDDKAGDRVRAEGIDILVNLNGYFGSPRMGLFARRPAPVQVNYLGFPATLGASYMDYIIADAVVIAPDEEQFYDEQVVRLPHCYQANDDRRPVASERPSRASQNLPEDAFVFCNFNQGYKLTPGMFGCWMRILAATPGSVLWLLESKPPFAENLRAAAAAQGVDAGRLIFARSVEPAQHLARLTCADLVLDTLPYNAHTTASDALWAGVPLLTCRGTAFPGRVAASLLQAIGLPELIAPTLQDYEREAIRLAQDRNAVRVLKEKLASNRTRYPLFDTARFARHIESAYAGMWARFKSGQAPAGFTVDDSG